MRFKIIYAFIALPVFIFANEITGIYLLPKDSKNRQSIVEIFKKNETFYGVGFATTNGINSDLDVNNPDKKLQNRAVRGSVFLNMNCANNKCNGKIYSFEKGKIYPFNASLENNILEIKINVFFGPTFTWQKLDNAEAAKYDDRRLDINTLKLME